MSFRIFSEMIIKEIADSISGIKVERIEAFLELLFHSKNIYCDGMGKSGLVVDSFATRLSQMGFYSYIVSGCTTTAITNNDLLIIGSGSGETPSLIEHAKKAKNIGAKVVLITTREVSSIGQICDIAITIPAPDKGTNTESSIQPMGSLFEQSLGIFFDTLVLMIMKCKSITVEEMYKNHNNLE